MLGSRRGAEGVGVLRRAAFAAGAVAAALIVAMAPSASAVADGGGILADAQIVPGLVVGGTAAQGTVALDAPVDVDTAVALGSTDTSVLTVPASVTVPAGTTTASFVVTTFVFSGPGEFACVNATAGGVTRTPCLNVNPSPLGGPEATAVTFSPASVSGGSPATGTVTLSAKADGNTSLVALSSSDPAVLGVPASVVPVSGQSTVAFPVTTEQVTAPSTVTVTATVDGTSASGTLTIVPATTPPTTDQVSITRAQWDRGILRIEATSSNPNAIMEVYLTSSDSFMFGLTNAGGGKYQAQHQWLDNPLSITVKSNFGGSATVSTA